MSWEFVTIEKSGRIATVRFDRGNAANAMSRQLLQELTEAAQSFESDSETSTVILTGRSDNFTLGMDLKDPAVERMRTDGLADRRLALKAGGRMCAAWEAIEPMTIAAIEGWCVGGGVALTVALDLRILGAGATMYVSEIERGMNMSWGSVPRITNLVGPAKAKRVVVMAEKVEAERAVLWGLADETVAAGEAYAKALEMAGRIAELPPVAVRMCKQDINAYANALNYTASHSDYDQYAVAQASGDFEEGVRSFLEKRPPKFTGQ